VDDSALLPPHLRAAPVAVASVDLGGRIVDANAALLEISGYSLEELRGRSFSEFIEREAADGPSTFLALTRGELEADRVERRYRSRAGELREVDLAVSLVRDAQGRPASVLAILQDVTAQKAAIREAAQRAAELEAVIESMPAAVFIGDGTGIQIANRTGLEQLGFTSVQELAHALEEVIATLHARDLLTGQPIPVDQLSFSRALRGEHVQNRIVVRHQRTGEDRVLQVTAAPIVLAGRIAGAVAVDVDITDQVHADEARREVAAERERLLAESRRAHREAEEASRVRDEFLAVLSHELRTPLNAVLGWTRILRSYQAGDQVDQAVAIIERNARAQARLIDDLLDLSRIITGKIRLQVEQVDVAAIATDSIESVRPAADAKRIALGVQIADHLPRATADPQRLQQVFWNLLSNAVKFTSPGGRVTLTLSATSEAIEAHVVDTGIGIPADVLPYVFDRFTQADSSSTRAHSGLGLGLAIVRHLIELHGGTVYVESPGPGNGATFGFSLPRSAADR
jgi:PAS domain S-box-containing protein